MIVGITGFAGSGKDTAAQALIDMGYERRAFADPLRTGILGVDPLINTPGGSILRLSAVVESYGWDRAKRDFPEIRRLLQTYGTEGGRDVHGQQCWIDAARRTLEPGKHYVFTDMRFPNEATFIHELGGVVIQIHRNGVGPANAHSSEQVVEDVDFGLANNGTINELHGAVLESVLDWHFANRPQIEKVILEAADRNGEVPSDYLLRKSTLDPRTWQPYPDANRREDEMFR